MVLLVGAACDAGPDAVVDTGQTPGAGAATAEAPAASKPGAPPASAGAAGKISGPVSVSYRIVGVPVVGQPLSIDLRIASAAGTQPVRIDYRILDNSALRLAEAQSPFATVAASTGQDAGSEQVTVVPLREGRLYLNVAASIDTEDGAMTTVTAIPIQVGNAPRERRENGELATDDSGETVRVLSGSED